MPLTETRNDKTKGMNLLLERVESPRSQRKAVILGSRGVTLPGTLFRHTKNKTKQKYTHTESTAHATIRIQQKYGYSRSVHATIE